MRVIFAGVGEACDPVEPTTCVVVEDGATRLLCDCGFTAAPAYWRAVTDPQRLDGVWISHFHGDHFFGLPQLCLRLWEDGRTAPLRLMGPEGLEDLVRQSLNLAYGSLLARLNFVLEFQPLTPGANASLGDLRLRCALGEHSRPSLAVRVDGPSGSVLVSGDGRPTPSTLELARGVDLLVQEAYGLTSRMPGHGTVAGALELAQAAGARALALVHLQRRVRQDQRAEVKALLAGAGLPAWLPSSGEMVDTAQWAQG